MEIFQVAVSSILVLLFLNMVQNLMILKQEKNLKHGNNSLVSVLIPVRNEEKNIKNCLDSLLNQDYPRLEIIVLDDNSTDRTFSIVKNITQNNPKVRLVKGEKLPSGWNGKNWACHQLSGLARGEWLLFTDADTIHYSHSVSTAVTAAQKNGFDFITCIPHLVAKTWAEKLYMPIIHFAFIVLLPFRLINYSGNSCIPLGIGPFMLIRKKFYFYCGGYKAIKTDIVDDIALSKRVKKSGGKVSVIGGEKMVKVRFYRSFREVWNGFSKNSYQAIGANPHYVVGIFLICYFLFIFPYLHLWGALHSSQSLFFPLFQVGLISLMKVILALRFHSSIIYGLLHPLSIVFALLILFNSLRLSVFKKKIEWKERFYPVDK